MKTGVPIVLLMLFQIFASCKSGNHNIDASGSFEADEIIVSSEGAGKILLFNIDEGSVLKAGDVVGVIDTMQLFLKKKQLMAMIAAILVKQPDINTQLASVQEQIHTAEREKTRITNLLKSDAATQKQLDDINAQIELLSKQYEAAKSSLSITSNSLNAEISPVAAQIDQINDQINKCLISNPANGNVLTKYTEQGEVTAPGKALYKIADLSDITLRVYVSGIQLSQIKTGQDVKVFVDAGEKSYKELSGRISWISDKAEFTPKTIQTKDERANLVYAVKVKVKNDGYLKIGMYGEVKF